MAQSKDGIPDFERLPGDLYFRHQDLPPTEWESHAHPWGQLNYLLHGSMFVEMGGQRFLSPPFYAVWIPPNIEHLSYNKVSATYRTVYLSEKLCEKLPPHPCPLSVSPLLRALLNEFARRDVRAPKSDVELHMAHVVLDQIEQAHPLDRFLPLGHSTKLNAILDDAMARDLDKRTIEQIAHDHNVTVRTLERRCKSELGVGFAEWRQRFRFMRAVEALDRGEAVQQIAFDLGYASSSAFIAMFRKTCGQTPDQFRRRSL